MTGLMPASSGAKSLVPPPSASACSVSAGWMSTSPVATTVNVLAGLAGAAEAGDTVAGWNGGTGSPTDPDPAQPTRSRATPQRPTVRRTPAILPASAKVDNPLASGPRIPRYGKAPTAPARAGRSCGQLGVRPGLRPPGSTLRQGTDSFGRRGPGLWTTRHALKGAFGALNALNAPFRAFLRSAAAAYQDERHYAGHYR